MKVQQGTPSSTIPRNGLVGEWLFNGNANDTSGKGNNGTVYGATSTTDRFGNPSKAYSFNNNYVLIPNSTDLNISTNQLSLCAWIYINSIPNSAGCVIDKSDANGFDRSYALYYKDNNSNDFDMILHTNNQYSSFYSLNQISINHWVFIVGVYDGTKVKLFTNGQFSTEYSCTGNIYVGNRNVSIGKGEEGTEWNFVGLIDDVRIYNRTLSDSEIQALYHESGWTGN
jgi:hypothetical protein